MNRLAGIKATDNIVNTFYHTPWINTTPELATFALHLHVAPDDSEGDAVLQRGAETMSRQTGRG